MNGSVKLNLLLQTCRALATVEAGLVDARRAAGEARRAGRTEDADRLDCEAWRLSAAILDGLRLKAELLGPAADPVADLFSRAVDQYSGRLE